MTKRHYIVGEEVLYGTAKKAFARAKVLGSNKQVRRLSKREVREIEEEA